MGHVNNILLGQTSRDKQIIKLHNSNVPLNSHEIQCRCIQSRKLKSDSVNTHVYHALA